MTFTGKAEEFLLLDQLSQGNAEDLLSDKKPSTLTLIWFTQDCSGVVIDGESHCFGKNTIICLTEFHQMALGDIKTARIIRFNRPFYCILDHDSEVGCKGALFFGASQLPIITIPEEAQDKFETVWKMFWMEMESEDALQLEMLQMMLKRILILCTRLYKEQHHFTALENPQADIVREFNFLVEKHFKTKHTVAEYADLLNKSPKTISNLFAKLGQKTPLQYIQERRALEARRMLGYSDQHIKEIAYALGHEDQQSFSRFFKKMEGLSPSDYREKIQMGKIATSSGKSA